MKLGLLMTLVLICYSVLVHAQKADLYVKSGEKALFLEHKVAPKESFFSIGRLYNVHPRHIASFNKVDINKGLQIDQRIRIPLTDTNFTQKGNSGTPVYFKPVSAMTLTEVSHLHQNVSAASLKAWNGLSGEQVKKDAKLIVGFLLSKEMPAVTIRTKPVVEEKPDTKPVPPEVAAVKKEPVEPVVEPVVTPEIKQPEVKQPEKVVERPVQQQRHPGRRHVDVDDACGVALEQVGRRQQQADHQPGHCQRQRCAPAPGKQPAGCGVQACWVGRPLPTRPGGLATGQMGAERGQHPRPSAISVPTARPRPCPMRDSRFPCLGKAWPLPGMRRGVQRGVSGVPAGLKKARSM